MRVGYISSRLQAQLASIEPLTDPSNRFALKHAGRAILRDGTTRERVVFSRVDEGVNERLANMSKLRLDWAPILKRCDVAPEIAEIFLRMQDNAYRKLEEEVSDTEISIDDVESIELSPLQTPVDVYRKIASFGETGMGYHWFELILADGRRLPCFSLGEFGFLDLPQDAAPADIVDAQPLKCDDPRPSEAVDAQQYRCPYIG